MKKFTFKISLFLLLFSGILGIGILLPPTSTNNILFSLQDKLRIVDSVQKLNSATPIIYWVGGSNVNFGIDSKLIGDSLQLPSVNTAVHGGLGLKFEINNALRFARKDDIVVLMPEYENFWNFNNEMADGQAELLHTIMDVYPEGRTLIEKDQWHHIAMYFPRYLHDKYIQYFPANYSRRNKKDLGVYTRHNYNTSGDAVLHLNKPPVPFLAMPEINAPVDEKIIDFLKVKNEEFISRGVHFLIFFPAYQQSSYNNNRKAIDQLYSLFLKQKLPVYSSPERYVFNDTLFYDTYYHLNKKGREIRSIFVQQDLKNCVAKIK